MRHLTNILVSTKNKFQITKVMDGRPHSKVNMQKTLLLNSCPHSPSNRKPEVIFLIKTLSPLSVSQNKNQDYMLPSKNLIEIFNKKEN